jgi:mono/diheme cytochrome c family protein
MGIAKRIYTLMIASFLSAITIACVAEPALDIQVGPTPQHFTRSELLRNPAVKTIDVSSDVAYHRDMRYQALPLAALIQHETPDSSLQFVATDGFVANIPAKLLQGDGQPWLAIETSDHAWPPLKAGDATSAGPFYLVWLTPQKSGVSQEQWPYQIAKISLALPLESRYPQIVPAASASSAAQRGLHVYTANCASCHPINGVGDAAIGPDLNLPHNPTEYFHEDYLRRLVRNPADVRNWAQRIMPGFSADVLSDAQLDDLLAYLRQMSAQRQH